MESFCLFQPAPRPGDKPVPGMAGKPAMQITIMAKTHPGAEQQTWEHRICMLISATLTLLCYRQSGLARPLSLQQIRASMSLRSLVNLYRKAVKNHWPEEVRQPLENYLTSLPGFTLAQINKPAEWTPDTFSQHSYLLRQASRNLAAFAGIFGANMP